MSKSRTGNDPSRSLVLEFKANLKPDTSFVEILLSTAWVLWYLRQSALMGFRPTKGISGSENSETEPQKTGKIT
jgi:hypothetical protein